MTGFESCRWTNSLQLFNSQSDPWQCVRESWTMAARSCLVSRDGRHWCSCCSLRLCVIFGVLKGNRAQSFNLHLHLPPARSSRQVAEFLDHPSRILEGSGRFGRLLVQVHIHVQELFFRVLFLHVCVAFLFGILRPAAFRSCSF